MVQLKVPIQVVCGYAAMAAARNLPLFPPNRSLYRQSRTVDKAPF